MQKLQILFPDPLLRQIKILSAEEDCSASEIIRRAVERFLLQKTSRPRGHVPFPTFKGGGVRVSAVDLKETLYEDDDL